MVPSNSEEKGRLSIVDDEHQWWGVTGSAADAKTRLMRKVQWTIC